MTLTNEPLAHLAKEGDRAHLLLDHLVAVGKRAAEFGTAFDAMEWARIAGQWHDLGKYSADFQVRIREENGYAAHIEPPDIVARDHSSAGAMHALALAARDGKRHIGVPLALVIAGHHAGLADAERLLKERLTVENKQERLDSALAGGAPAAILEAAIPSLPPWLLKMQSPSHRCDLELWIRLLFSALCDADFLDTEAFYSQARAALRGSSVVLAELEARLSTHVAQLEARAPDTEVNRVRAEVRRACSQAATQPPGAFSLTVPTGGGKTLASLSFALQHAAHHGLRRVVVAIPFTSIIEQTAEVYRAALGDAAVLEHHSALEPSRETPQSRVAAENWDAPVVVTTTVQLFESLLANRPSACRKLHRLAHSVIILDEAQAVRIGSLKPVLDVLRSLIEHHGVSVVVSTATQPAWGASSFLPEGLPNVREIVPESLRAFERLRRVTVRWPSTNSSTEWTSLAEEIAAEPDCLSIVHLRNDARALCAAVDRATGSAGTFHLSALMCADHRSAVLRSIRTEKAAGHPVRTVSTQLVEAGVDLDFRVVYRALAGLDALAQAAGRCNREGKHERGELRVFIAPTEPPIGVLRTGQAVARSLLQQQPELDLFGNKIHKQYFEKLFNARDLDDKQIQRQRAGLCFRSVAEQFRLIDDDWSAPLIVPWGRAAELIQQLERTGPTRDGLRALQRFTINISKKQRDAWLASGHVHEVAGVVVLSPLFAKAYDPRFGLVPERMGVADPALLIA